MNNDPTPATQGAADMLLDANDVQALIRRIGELEREHDEARRECDENAVRLQSVSGDYARLVDTNKRLRERNDTAARAIDMQERDRAALRLQLAAVEKERDTAWESRDEILSRLRGEVTDLRLDIFRATDALERLEQHHTKATNDTYCSCRICGGYNRPPEKRIHHTGACPLAVLNATTRAPEPGEGENHG